MGIFKSSKGTLISDYFKPLHDIGPIKAGVDVADVALYEDHLEIKVPLKKFEPLTLQYSQITDVFHGLKPEIVEKDRSVIGRAVAGGILLGGVGAVVGGLSGVGKKKEVQQVSRLLIISYVNKNGEDAFLQFEDTRNWHGKKLAAMLKDMCHIEEKKHGTEL